jgi:hypothetical protein
MTYTVKLTHNEIALLQDALKKGSSRHASFARFYPGRRDQHTAIVNGMERLKLKLQQLIHD